MTSGLLEVLDDVAVAAGHDRGAVAEAAHGSAVGLAFAVVDELKRRAEQFFVTSWSSFLLSVC